MKKYHTFIKSAVGIAVVFGLFKIMIIPVKVDGNSMLGMTGILLYLIDGLFLKNLFSDLMLL